MVLGVVGADTGRAARVGVPVPGRVRRPCSQPDHARPRPRRHQLGARDMTAPTLIDGLTPPVGNDVAATALVLARRFPGALVWFGTYSRRWWAMVWAGGRYRL